MTKYGIPLFYALSMAVKGVDDTVDIQSIRIQPNHAWVPNICIRAWWEV